MKFLFDLFPILLFFLAYKLYDIYVATAVAIAAAFLQTGLYWLKNRKFETMHLVTLGILIVFGGLTLALHDPLFIKWKPTVVNWLFAVIFLGSRFIGERTLVERMMSHAISAPAAVWLHRHRLGESFCRLPFQRGDLGQFQTIRNAGADAHVRFRTGHLPQPVHGNR